MALARSPRKSPRWQTPATPRKLGSLQQRELDEMPARIEAAEKRLAELDVRVADPALYRGPAAERARVEGERAAAAAELERLFARWEKLEALRAASG